MDYPLDLFQRMLQNMDVLVLGAAIMATIIALIPQRYAMVVVRMDKIAFGFALVLTYFALRLILPELKPQQTTGFIIACVAAFAAFIGFTLHKRMQKRSAKVVVKLTRDTDTPVSTPAGATPVITADASATPAGSTPIIAAPAAVVPVTPVAAATVKTSRVRVRKASKATGA